MASCVSLTEQLRTCMQGDSAATDALLREILPKLHEIAVRELRRERYVAPLSKTELIHEIWLSSISRGNWQIRDRGHFFALACLAMRRVLVDLARKRLADRRGGGETTLPLDDAAPMARHERDAQQIVEIGIAMERLEAVDPEAARVVDMHYFTGATLEEIAKETGFTFRQARYRWERGRRALKALLRGRAGAGEPNL